MTMIKMTSMITRISAFALVCMVFMTSCSKPETGAAKRAMDDLYPHNDYLKTVYTESMIRSAANMAGLDSSFAISSQTDYIYQFEVERDFRYFKPSTDSVIQHAIDQSALEKVFEIRQPDKRMSSYVHEKDGRIVDAVFFEQDSTKVRLMEFVGNMPIDVLFKEGLKSYAEFGDALNLELYTDERNDTTDQ